MSNELGQDEMYCLESLFYNPLKKNMKGGKKSIFLKFFNTTQGSMNKYINASSVPSSDLLDLSEYIQKFLSEGYIIESTYPETYVITPKGVWEVEFRNGIVNLDFVFSHFKNQYFNFSTKSLDDNKSKIALFTLISIGAFCKNTPFSINRDELSKEKTKEVFYNSYNFLMKLGLLPSDLCFGSPNDNENELQYEFRHLKNLKPDTKGIYDFDRDFKYWISIYDYTTGEINIDYLSYLFWQIFNKPINWEQRKEIEQYCSQQLNNYITYIFTKEELDCHYSRKFGNEKVISDALFKLNEKYDFYNSS
jgi:hypothetical protein